MAGLKVLMLTDAWSFTAEAQNTLELSCALQERGHRLVLICKGGTPLADRAFTRGLDVRPLRGLRPGWNLLAGLAAWLKVLRMVARIKPDIVHVHRSSVHVLGLLAARRIGAALVRTRANVDNLRRGAINRLLYDRWTDKTLVTAEAVKTRLRDAGFDGDRCEVLFGAVDSQRFRARPERREALRKELGIEPGEQVIGCLARLAPVKGHRYLIAAFSRLVQEMPDQALRLVLVGQAWPGMAAEVERCGVEHGVQDRILWLGRRQDVADLVNAFDVGVVASVGSEALSRASLEYMATGVPVVATRVGGIPEIIEPGQQGLLVPPANPDALSEALGQLLRDADLRTALGRAGRRRVEQLFTLEREVSDLERVYQQVLHPTGAGASRLSG